MSDLLHRRLTAENLSALVEGAPRDPVVLTHDQRQNVTARFRAVPSPGHRRLDAWSVERGGAPDRGFRWSSAGARRLLANAALRRVRARAATPLLDAVREALDDQLLRAAAGYARPGSLARWLADVPPAVHGVVVADALGWAATVLEATRRLERDWRVADHDAYYDVSGARTTLRARRDLLVGLDAARVVVRVRAGSPGKSAGPGLRADLAVDALAEDGNASARVIGIWPDAGVALAVDGTLEDLRAGARDLVRAAIVRQRRPAALAA